MTKKEASNQVSGTINLVRNVGGSIFIAVTGAIVTNRSLFHQARLQQFMQPGSPAFVDRVMRLHHSSVVQEKGHAPVSWLEPPSIRSSTNRQPHWLIRTSTVYFPGWQWAGAVCFSSKQEQTRSRRSGRTSNALELQDALFVGLLVGLTAEAGSSQSSSQLICNSCVRSRIASPRASPK
jgi:hypothetical protein